MCYCVEWLTLVYIDLYMQNIIVNWYSIPLCTSKLCAVDISNSFLWYDLPLCEFWVPVCYSCIEGLMRYTSKYVECAQAYYIYVDSGVASLNGLWLLLNFGYYLQTMFSHCFQNLITGNVFELNWIDLIGLYPLAKLNAMRWVLTYLLLE